MKQRLEQQLVRRVKLLSPSLSHELLQQASHPIALKRGLSPDVQLLLDRFEFFLARRYRHRDSRRSQKTEEETKK